MTADRPFIDLCYDLARVIPDLVDCAQSLAWAVVIVAVAFGVRVAFSAADQVRGWWR